MTVPAGLDPATPAPPPGNRCRDENGSGIRAAHTVLDTGGMSPPTEKRRPAVNGAATSGAGRHTDHRSLRPAGATSTVDVLDREWIAGYLTGRDVGYRACQYEQTREWVEEIESSPKLAATRGPSLSELKRIRETLPEDRHGQPCDCPRCGWVARHHGDHLGGPVPWTAVERVAS